MKRISLIYGYSARNAGDFAITLGAIDVLRVLGCKIRLFSRYQHTQKDFVDSSNYLRDRYGDSIEIYEGPFYLDRSENLFSSLVHYANGALIAFGLKGNKSFCENLLDADEVVFNGGNLFRCQSFIDYTRLCALMYPLCVARRKKVPYSIFPQSASVLSQRGQKKLLPLLADAKRVFFREKDSFGYVSSLMPSDNFIQTIDLAFFIDKSSLKKVERQNVIALTLRFFTVGDIAELPQNEIDSIFTKMGSIVETYKDEYQFMVVIQTDKDEKMSRKFAQEYGLDVFKSNDPVELLQFYQSVSMLIGMRLHSIILALSVGTPCCGIFYKQWGLKNSGLMKYFDMPFELMDEAGPCNDVSQSIKGLLKDRNLVEKQIKDKVQKAFNEFIERNTL